MIGAYDTTPDTGHRVQVIQVWGTYYDGYEPSDIKTDKFGNVYAVGTTYGTSGLSTRDIPECLSAAVVLDGYIVKFDKNRQAPMGHLLWGTGDDNIYGCSVDTFGNLFISGILTSPNGIALNGFRNTRSIACLTPFLVLMLFWSNLIRAVGASGALIWEVSGRYKLLGPVLYPRGG
jgi:hypothetical protein